MTMIVKTMVNCTCVYHVRSGQLIRWGSYLVAPCTHPLAQCGGPRHPVHPGEDDPAGERQQPARLGRDCGRRCRAAPERDHGTEFAVADTTRRDQDRTAGCPHRGRQGWQTWFGTNFLASACNAAQRAPGTPSPADHRDPRALSTLRTRVGAGRRLPAPRAPRAPLGREVIATPARPRRTVRSQRLRGRRRRGLRQLSSSPVRRRTPSRRAGIGLAVRAPGRNR